ncbi:hypothetical protein Pyn_31216 [Prunus yedoensis var. nudiflora]|uniref:Uncharacterized protein n=1 Tax=Prunus yedoensis var. nudiflora TaxID=2094558 RepID=A0A314YDI1_PRUYE|nr:hypothetical protein Pyn_31216 [Prunus yedoensis var. nudiflora]
MASLVGYLTRSGGPSFRSCFLFRVQPCFAHQIADQGYWMPLVVVPALGNWAFSRRLLMGIIYPGHEACWRHRCRRSVSQTSQPHPSPRVGS